MNHEHGMRYVRVVVDRAIHRELDYSVPESLAGRVGIGSRVRVPFREKSALATVVAIPEQSEAKGIRSIEAIIGDAPVLSEQLLELARWIGTYYCCPTETVMRSVLPQVIRRAEVGWKKQLFVQPARDVNEAEFEKLRHAHRGRRNSWRRFRSWKSRYARRNSCGKPRSITKRCARS